MNFTQPNFWRKTKLLDPLAILLLPFSVLYFSLSLLRKLLAKPVKLPVLTITVGNVTVGGAGKTPTAIKLMQLIEALNFSACFLTKGYKGELEGPEFISKNAKVKETGDEAKLLRKHAEVLVSKKRQRAGEKLAGNKYEVAILDDGFQNPNIIHDLKILVIDSNYLFGNGLLMPAGPLRQSKRSALKEAQLILLIGGSELPKELLPYADKVFTASYRVKGSYDPKLKYMAFSGLANNRKFFDFLKEQGLNIVEQAEFPDHYNYRKDDIVKLKKNAGTNGLTLITTSKDHVKLPQKYLEEIVEFKIELVINNQSQFLKLLKSHVKKA